MSYLLKNKGLFKMLGFVFTLRSGTTFTPYSTSAGVVLLCHGTHENEEVRWAPCTGHLCSAVLGLTGHNSSFPCNGICFVSERVKVGSGLVRCPKQVERLTFPEWL